MVVGTSGLYDQWRRLRVTPGLTGLVDAQPAAPAYEETVERHSVEGQEQRKQLARGRVFYLPALRFNGSLPAFGSYFNIDNRFWKNPANARQFLDGLSWARNGEASVQVEGPKSLIANAVEQPSNRLTLVHLVNYNAHQGSLEQVQVRCRNPKSARVASVRLYSPDLAEAQELKADVAFSIPEVKTYVIAAVAWT